MRITFYADQEEVPSGVNIKIPEDAKQYLLPFGHHTWTSGKFGGILQQEFGTAKYSVNIVDFIIKKPASLFARTNESLLTFALALSGTCVLNLKSASSVFIQEAHQYIFNLSSQLSNELQFISGHVRIIFFTIAGEAFSAYASKSPAILGLASKLNIYLPAETQRLEAPFSLRTLAILNEIEHYHDHKEFLDSFMNERIFELLIGYSQNLFQPRSLTGYSSEIKSRAERLLMARDLIDKHQGIPLTIEQIARKHGLNTKVLKLGFKEMFRNTVGHYQLSKRMDRALQLLIETDESIEAICDAIGYDDRSSFARRFKLIYKMTPLQYRMKHRDALETKRIT